MGSASNARQNNFDLLRFLLASAVIFSHAYALLGQPDREPLARLTGRESVGSIAVDGFFVISGFLIAASWLRTPATKKFLEKRVLRIYPGLIGAVLACYLLASPLVSPLGVRVLALPANIYGCVRSILFLGPYASEALLNRNPYPYALNGSLWTIKYEFFCYLGVVALGISGVLSRRRLLAGLFLISCVAAFVVAQWIPGLHWPRINVHGAQPLYMFFGDPGYWPRLISYYLAGVTAYTYRRELPLKAPFAAVAFVVLIASSWPFSQVLAITGPLAYGYLILFAALSVRAGVEHFGRYGDFSYGIYLYGFPVEQLLVAYGHHWKPWTLTAAAVPLTIVCGIASWFLIERPFLGAKPGLSKSDPIAERLLPEPSPVADLVGGEKK